MTDPTPPDIVRSAYVDLVVTDLRRARAWWVDVIGFHVEHEEPDALYLRGYEEFVHHSVVLRSGAAPACERIGFRVRTADDLDRAERFYAARGCPVRRVPAGTTPGFGEAVRTVDPLGFPIELVHQMERVEPLVQRYDLRHGASINRLDHVNIATPNVPVAHQLYDDLGFGLSETIEDLQTGTLYAAWMFRKQTVHDMAFTLGRGPMLHHIAFAVPESRDVLSLCDQLGARDMARHIERGPGRHGVSNAFYLYLRDDDGHRIEIYTTDYFTGDPDHEPIRWDVHDERRRDFWANAIVPGWYEGSVGVLDLDGEPVPTRAQEEATTEKEAAGPRVKVGADGLGIVVEN
ncbi:MAG TPA: 3,4-dihydroxyphenylacetate 2,3-dioxygenase [Ilumatobacter sp.]|jgi:catechol 2,3-dioxygenase|nr:3,4-dihydroxyphenylacetate 2,3-dioxygenase [Ilumatobacter sp.]